MTETPTIETVVGLTVRAAAECKTLLTLPENAGKSYRVYVEKGGCSGMQYGMVFDEKRDGDLTAEQQGVPVTVDPFSAKYVEGAVVDFSDARTGSGFKISNPQAKAHCLCGKFFET